MAPSPRLTHCPEGLPRDAYLSPVWFTREMRAIFSRDWICAGPLAEVPPGTMRRVMLGDAAVLLCRAADGALAAYHNTCPHRGAELCAAPEAPLGALIRCAYHAWAFAAGDGRLISTGHAHPTPDFDPAAHGLKPVALRLWAGFVFLSAAAVPGPLVADVPLSTLDRWPMEALTTGHRHSVTIPCNWKVFWENYSECLHCPGVHPELCDLVPVYRQGLMAPDEAPGPAPDLPAFEPGALKPDAVTWSADGQPCGPVFPALTDAERAAGHTFVTLWPSAFVVAHVDHARLVTLEPLGPGETRLTARWLFPPETLAQPGFDAARVAAFATRVLEQDAAACALNQRGIASPAFARARLMPEEYEIHRFHRWVLSRLEECP